MTYRTVEGILHPDGTVVLPREEILDRPMHVMVTILEEAEAEDASLLEPGDYLDQLEEYEERLARGEIQWQ